jgi:hypothetical protein
VSNVNGSFFNFRERVTFASNCTGPCRCASRGHSWVQSLSLDSHIFSLFAKLVGFFIFLLFFDHA